VTEFPQATLEAHIALANRLLVESKERPVAGIEWVQAYVTDISTLGERCEELDLRCDQLVRHIEGLGSQIERLREENARMRDFLRDLLKDEYLYEDEMPRLKEILAKADG
jgi:predicted RNase H-like nuclease (RuvC/YqgF family)